MGTLTQDNMSQYQNPTSSSSTAIQPTDWCTTATGPPDFHFPENVRFIIPIHQGTNPQFFFNLFLTNEVVTFMVNETNHYAEKKVNETIIRQKVTL